MNNDGAARAKIPNALATALMLLVLLQSVIAMRAILDLMSRVSDPYTQVDSKVLNADVKLGEPVRILRKFSRRAYCKVDIDRFILRLPEKTLVRRERIPGGAAGLGVEEITVLLDTVVPAIDAHLPAGTYLVGGARALEVGREYLLREFLHSDCGDRLHTAPVPDLRFRVVE